MAATKLSVYRAALRFLADARIATTTDGVDASYALDNSWDSAVAFVLREAAWRFALVTATLATSAAVIAGYAHGYAYPANWLRTQAIFLSRIDGREAPLDLREQGLDILTNSATAPTMRFVSSIYADPELALHPWPEQFAQLVAAYLAFTAAHKITGDAGATARMSELFSSLLPEAVRIDAVPEDRWLPYQRSGTMLLGARIVLVQGGGWQFALKTVVPATGGTAAPGYAHCFVHPADMIVPHSLFVSQATGPGAGREFPFDVREHDTHWSANIAAFQARYLSTDGLNALLWPDSFRRALLAWLDAEGSGSPDAKDGGAYPALLAAGMRSDSLAESPWLIAQLDGSFLRASRAVMGRGYWRWGLKEIQLNPDDQLDTPPDYGFPYRFPLPADRLRTHALFVPWDGGAVPVNIRETAQDWSTDASTFVARYLSTDVLDASGGADPTKAWPELVLDTALAWVDWQTAAAAELKAKETTFNRLLAEALLAHSMPEDDWLRFQLDGSFRQAAAMLLEAGRWRFAVRSRDLVPSSDPLPEEGSDGSVSSSYTYRFIKPNDLLRTIWVYYNCSADNPPPPGLGATRKDIDYRDEGDAIHANYGLVTIRYVSRLGLDATKWPGHFRRAMRACLLHLENPTDPKLLALYQAADAVAEQLDDSLDMPPIRHDSRFTRGRRQGRQNFDYGIGYAVGTVGTGDDNTLTTDSGDDTLTSG